MEFAESMITFAPKYNNILSKKNTYLKNHHIAAMKNRSIIPLLLPVLLGSLSPCVAEARDFVRRGPGIEVVDETGTDARVWNLGNTYELDARERRAAPRYLAVSSTDSLGQHICLSEIIEGRRMRYILDGLTVSWQGEETSQMIVCPPSPLPSMAFAGSHAGTNGTNGIQEAKTYHSTGHYGQSVTIGQDGVYSSRLTGDGLIVMGTDTLPGRMTTEKREYTMALSVIKSDSGTDSAAQSPARKYVWRRHRWFVDGEKLPVAVQTDARVLDASNGKTLRNRSVLYTVDSPELAMEKSENRKGEKGKIQDETEVEWEGDRIVIRTGTGGDVVIGITTPDGLPCLTRTARLQPGEPFGISVPELSPDRKYIFCITASGRTYKKLISRK